MKAMWKCPLCNFEGAYDEVLQHLREVHGAEKTSCLTIRARVCPEHPSEHVDVWRLTNDILLVVVHAPNCRDRVDVDNLFKAVELLKEYLEREGIEYTRIWLALKESWEYYDGLYIDDIIPFYVRINPSKVPTCDSTPSQTCMCD